MPVRAKLQQNQHIHGVKVVVQGIEKMGLVLKHHDVLSRVLKFLLGIAVNSHGIPSYKIVSPPALQTLAP
jgi:hypothetical protein